MSLAELRNQCWLRIGGLSLGYDCPILIALSRSNYKGYARPCLLPVSFVVSAKELNQRSLLGYVSTLSVCFFIR